MEIPKVIDSSETNIRAPLAPGHPSYCDIKPILQAVSEYMKADDVDIALYILDNLPGYYRDHVPVEATELKRKIFENLMTVQDYVYSAEDIACKASLDSLVQYYNHPSQYRFHVVANKIKELNEKDIIPHLTELGPGEYWLAYGMKMAGLKFTYWPIVLSKPCMARACELLGERVKLADPQQTEIFVCLETVEHMWAPVELFHYYARYKCDAKYLFLSTPKYTCFGGLPDWDTRTIAHLKTYTPAEFFKFITTYWPGYTWKHHDTDMIIMEGEK